MLKLADGGLFSHVLSMFECDSFLRLACPLEILYDLAEEHFSKVILIFSSLELGGITNCDQFSPFFLCLKSTHHAGGINSTPNPYATVSSLCIFKGNLLSHSNTVQTPSPFDVFN